MERAEFSYYLPPELIAQEPSKERDRSRLMVLNRSQNTIEHKSFWNLPCLLNKGDLLVLNNSRVFPARLLCRGESGNIVMELLLLQKREGTVWEVLAHPGKKAKPGRMFWFGERLCGKVLEVLPTGNRLVEFECEGDFWETLNSVGELPLPHYIKAELKEPERYQTIYSSKIGSVAAPTAGLHFTPKLLKELEEKGVNIGFVTLHVGLGTFRPVRANNIAEHKMHKEFFELPSETARLIKETKQAGGRVIAVGTTSCRTLEAVWAQNGEIKPCAGATQIFIYPGFDFKVVDALITNFHLPESTLIMLVAAFCGLDFTMQAYKLAVKQKYRFFSFGDAMLIL